MTRFVLHIGPHKTGTSYVQKQLAENRGMLMQAGVHYPQTGVTVQWGHHGVPAELLRHGVSASLGRILEESAGRDCVLLSSENFDRLGDAEVAALAGQLRGRPVTLVYVHRGAERLLLSNWQENVKHGDPTTWSDHFLAHFARPQRSEILNPCRLLDRYRETLSAEVCILDYASEVAGGDLARAVLRVASSSAAERIRTVPEKVNASRPIVDTEIHRALNAMYLADTGRRPGRLFGGGFAPAAAAGYAESLELLRRCVTRDLVDAEVLGSGIVASLQERFERRYGQSVVGRLSPPDSESQPYRRPSANWVLRREAVAALRELYFRLGQGEGGG